jgi:hypothetical protein
MSEATTDRSKIKAIALDDPWGALETAEGATAVRRAVERLRRAGYTQSDRTVTDPAMDRDRPVRLFQRFWKGVTWVVLASWDGSFAYRVPVEVFRPDALFTVPSSDDLSAFMPDGAELNGDDQQTLKELEQHALDSDARERLRQVRWIKVGLFTEVVEAIIELPELPGHSHFATARSASVTA